MALIFFLICMAFFVVVLSVLLDISSTEVQEVFPDEVYEIHIEAETPYDRDIRYKVMIIDNLRHVDGKYYVKYKVVECDEMFHGPKEDVLEQNLFLEIYKPSKLEI